MQHAFVKSKLHRATVTGANLHYVESITIDSDLMVLAGLLPHERVQVVDMDNGARLETYVIAGPTGSGEVALNSVATRLVSPGDVIIMSDAVYDETQALAHVPTVEMLDEANRPTVVGPDASTASRPASPAPAGGPERPGELVP